MKVYYAKGRTTNVVAGRYIGPWLRCTASGRAGALLECFLVMESAESGPDHRAFTIQTDGGIKVRVYIAHNGQDHDCTGDERYVQHVLALLQAGAFESEMPAIKFPSAEQVAADADSDIPF